MPSQPLWDTRGLRLLHQMTGSHVTAWVLARRYRTWEELAAAPRMELADLLGSAGLRLRIPALPPELLPLPHGVWALPRTSPQYPAGVVTAHGAHAPVVIYGWGSTTAIPAAGTVAVGGALYADAAGTRRTEAVVSRLSLEHRSVAAVADYTGVGHAALEAAAASGSPAVGWLGGEIAAGSQAGLLARVVDAGGCVMTACPPGTGVSEYGLAEATRLAGCASSEAVLIEAGPARELGATLVRSALAHDRPLYIALGDDIDAGDPAGLLYRALLHPRRCAPAVAAAGIDLGPATVAQVAAGKAAATIVSA
jgi:hypothetical protein